MSHILLIEDDQRLGPTLKRGLAEQRYAVSLVRDAQSAIEHLKEDSPDLIVLDLGLPDVDGVDLLRRLRKEGVESPVLVLTARDTVEDRVHGLDAGADDYLVKPFAFVELLARLRALLRRRSSDSPTLSTGNITIDLVTRHVVQNGQGVELAPREFELLAYLMQHAGEIVSRSMLTEHVWRETSRFTPLDNVIDVHVSRLRRKLNLNSDVCKLEVVRGVGFRLRDAT